MNIVNNNTEKLLEILEKVQDLPETSNNVEQATPTISVSSGGLITASATQEAGVVAAGTKSATKQLTTKGATTITPTDAEQTAVSAGTFVTGDIVVGASTGSQVAMGSVTASGTTVTITPGFVVKTLLMAFTDPGLNGESRIEYSNGRAYVYYYSYANDRVMSGSATINTNNGTLEITVPSATSLNGTYKWMAAS